LTGSPRIAGIEGAADVKDAEVRHADLAITDKGREAELLADELILAQARKIQEPAMRLQG
jgi:hypothetical protein